MAIVLLSKLDKQTFTDPVLANMMGGLTKQLVHKIRKRDWNKYKMPVFVGKKLKE